MILLSIFWLQYCHDDIKKRLMGECPNHHLLCGCSLNAMESEAKEKRNDREGFRIIGHPCGRARETPGDHFVHHRSMITEMEVYKPHVYLFGCIALVFRYPGKLISFLSDF